MIPFNEVKPSTVLAVHDDPSTDYPSKAVLRALQEKNAELERKVHQMACAIEEMRDARAKDQEEIMHLNDDREQNHTEI